MKRHFVDGSQGTLGGGVVQTERLHLVAKKFDAHRVLVDRGKNVDDRPAYRKGSRILDHLGAAVAGSAKVLDQSLPVEGGVGLDQAAEISELPRGNHPPKHCSSRRHHHGRHLAVA